MIVSKNTNIRDIRIGKDIPVQMVYEGDCLVWKRKTESSYPGLCFTAQDPDANMRLDFYGESQYQISYDGIAWQDYESEQNITLYQGESVYFKAKTHNDSTNGHFSIYQGKIGASGNVMSMLDPECQQLSVGENGIGHLFEMCTDLVSAPELPATDLGTYCYFNTFRNCWNLTSAPYLPAVRTGYDSYFGMFSGCQILNSLSVNLEEWQSGGYPDWVGSVSENGTFYITNNILEEKKERYKYIPETWDVVRTVQ